MLRLLAGRADLEPPDRMAGQKRDLVLDGIGRLDVCRFRDFVGRNHATRFAGLPKTFRQIVHSPILSRLPRPNFDGDAEAELGFNI